MCKISINRPLKLSTCTLLISMCRMCVCRSRYISFCECSDPKPKLNYVPLSYYIDVAHLRAKHSSLCKSWKSKSVICHLSSDNKWMSHSGCVLSLTGLLFTSIFQAKKPAELGQAKYQLMSPTFVAVTNFLWLFSVLVTMTNCLLLCLVIWSCFVIVAVIRYLQLCFLLCCGNYLQLCLVSCCHLHLRAKLHLPFLWEDSTV